MPMKTQADRRDDFDDKTCFNSGQQTSLRRLILALVAVLLAVLGFCLRKRFALETAQSYALCSTSGKQIYLGDEQNSQVGCLAVQGSYIQDVGDLVDIQQRWTYNQGKALPIYYVKPGSIIVPGMSDSHAHILEYGASRIIPLEQGRTIKEVVQSVRDYIVSDPDINNNKSKLVQGWGWDHTVWPEGRWPNADDLDEDPVIHGRPVILQSKDGHAIWVSRTTLNDNTPFPEDVEGGVIERDSDGNPNGLFIDNAQDLIHKPEATDADLNRLFSITVRDALASGLTSIHDAALAPESLAFFKRKAEEKTLPIRIYGMTYFNESGEYWGDRIVPLINAGNGRLHCRSVKMFADGALRTGGAALYEPYTDNPTTNGVMRMPPELINKVIPRFLQDGWQVNVHAIGDRANGIVLDAFEKALSGIDVATLRPRLEHAQLLTEADMKRVGELGVIASVQPTHVIDDMWYAEDRLGAERIKRLYAFRSLVDNKAKITLGSDAPVEGINPLAGFYAAITRLSKDGESPRGPDGWFPGQRLTRQEALRGMTIDPAYASFTESTLGSLVPGKRADFVILSQDIMSVAVDKILETRVVATVLDGRPVYGSFL
ncbi:amidohydrolase family-domain-containing protein [Armillaria novae-zelandiae]|uniref:Amidohydrolase family-domain-containing protein n=1 Tax=Armillaria novae-zelandiae TaxID=153914 RepID=A0AA39PKH3_9AGAR|nr:amidohydrolase family-domain-containing protein [Armillaria novae-zelandiae]